MSNKCFVTKLPTAVENQNLPVLGHTKITMGKMTKAAAVNVANGSNIMSLVLTPGTKVQFSKPITIYQVTTYNIGGIANVQGWNKNNKTATATNVTEFTFLNKNAYLIDAGDNDSVTLDISNKYNLAGIGNWHNYQESCEIGLDISDLAFSSNITNLVMNDSPLVTGNINSLKDKNNLTYIWLSNTSVSGDISALSSLTNVSQVQLSNTSVSGDISALSSLTNVSSIQLSNTSVSGDISALSNLTNVSSIQLSNTSVSGDISTLKSLNKLGGIDIENTNITGDIDEVLKEVTKALNGTSKHINVLYLPSQVYFTRNGQKVYGGRHHVNFNTDGTYTVADY